MPNAKSKAAFKKQISCIHTTFSVRIWTTPLASLIGSYHFEPLFIRAILQDEYFQYAKSENRVWVSQRKPTACNLLKNDTVLPEAVAKRSAARLQRVTPTHVLQNIYESLINETANAMLLQTVTCTACCTPEMKIDVWKKMGRKEHHGVVEWCCIPNLEKPTSEQEIPRISHSKEKRRRTT